MMKARNLLSWGRKRIQRCQCYNMFTWFTIMIHYCCRVYIVEHNCEAKTSKYFYVCFGGWLTILSPTSGYKRNTKSKEWWKARLLGRFNDADSIASPSLSWITSSLHTYLIVMRDLYSVGAGQSVWFNITHLLSHGFEILMHWLGCQITWTKLCVPLLLSLNFVAQLG